MAKVELVINGGGWSPGYSGDAIAIDEYADKSWLEFQAIDLISQLTSQRKVLQRKIDAARKRLKRLTGRLNAMEKNWAIA